MAIIQKVSFSDFERAFINMGRNDQFTYEGKWALFNYLEEYSEELGEPLELDVIGLCCDYVELSSVEIKTQYDIDCDDDIDDDDIDTVLDLLSEKTAVIGHHYCTKENQYYIIFEAY